MARAAPAGATAYHPYGKGPGQDPRRRSATPGARCRRAPLLLVVLLGLGLSATAGCGDTVEAGRKEVHPEVEALYDEALRSSVAEVPGSEPVRLVLRYDERGEPVWHSTVVAADGTEYTVRTAATTGDLTSPPVPGEPAPERTEVLLEKAKLLPEEAARKVTVPDFGKVTGLALGETEGRTVWFVEVTTVDEGHVRRSAVDAVTGKTVSSRLLPETSPSAS